MMHFFPAATYQQRRNGLKASLNSGIVLLPGNEESPMNYTDNTYPFRQDSTFSYYGGPAKPGLAIVIDLEDGTTTLFGEDVSIDDVVWMGPMPTLSELASRSGIEKVGSLSQLSDVLQKAKDGNRLIHYLPPYRGETSIALSKWLAKPIAEVDQGISVDLIKAVVGQRSLKDEEELQEIERALAITKKMHLEMIYEARPGIKESTLVAKVMEIAFEYDVFPAYPVILSVHGEILHNHHHHHTAASGQLILGDFGVETKLGYASDITRTTPVSPNFSNQQREIYAIVLAAQEAAIQALAPDIPHFNVHMIAAKEIAKGLKSLGLMKGKVEDAVQAGAHALFFPHGLGHMMGMDVHDMEGLGEAHVGYDDKTTRSTQFGTKSLRLGRALKPGFVLTVEPGIYFIPELINKWESEGLYKEFISYKKLNAYKQFGGIRVEDNFVITESGHRLLGPKIPKSIQEIEFLRSA